MTEQTKTRMYLGRFDGDVLVDVTHFTSMDDRCVPSSIANLIVPGRQSYTDWDGDVWVPLTEGRVIEQRADMGGACCWCEFPQARFKYEPVPASAAVGGFKWMVLRDPDFWVMFSLSALVLGTIAAFIVGVTEWVTS